MGQTPLGARREHRTSQMAWLVSAKEIRFFTALRVYFSIYVRGFLGVKESQVSYGRIHKKNSFQ